MKNWIAFPAMIAMMCLLGWPTDGFTQTTASEEMQEDSVYKPYRPEADAQADIDSLVRLAGQDGKRIVIQAGGNWCVWCLRFNDFITQRASIRELIDSHFHYYHLNFSPENKNEEVFQRYAPGKGEVYGYPFFIVLDAIGQVLTDRESGSLEEGESYNEQKVLDFFRQWAPAQ